MAKLRHSGGAPGETCQRPPEEGLEEALRILARLIARDVLKKRGELALRDLTDEETPDLLERLLG